MPAPRVPPRVLLWFALAATAAAIAVFWLLKPAPTNLVLIVVDTLRADALGCYGGTKAATPRIDALAASGLRHELALGSFHQTTASMAAMFLASTPSLEAHDGAALPWNRWTHCGMSRFGTGAAQSECLPLDAPTLAERLNREGYRTVGVCSNSLLFRPAGFDRGFDVWREVGSTAAKPDDVRLAEYARKQAASRDGTHVLDAALDEASRLDERPFFLYVHLMDAHDWWTPGVPGRNFQHTANYWPAVETVDHAIGQLIDGLEARGLLENTAIVLTADHAESLNEPHPIASLPTHQGNPTYETVARIPLVVADPTGRIEEALRPVGMWRTQDLTSMLSSTLPIAAPRGPESVLGPDDCYYSELQYRTLRHGSRKITCQRGTGGAPGRCALFDLKADPDERHDIAEQRPEELKDMLSRMETIAAALRAKDEVPEPGAPSREELDRLRALGYAH